jgi:hypothetical protein
VWPMDPEPVLKKFPLPTPQAPMDPEFVQLERVTNLKDLQKLYNQVVPDKSSKEAKCLTSSLHFLSAQFDLVLAENTGLRASLLGKKKYKIKGQVLSTLTNSSGALTMSPSTIQSALGLLAQKDQERERELARKTSSKAARQAAKANKLALQAAAAKRRIVDKERRKREKEEKAHKLAQQRRERAEAKLAPPPSKKRKQIPNPVSNRPPKKQAIRQPGGRASGVGEGGVSSEPKPSSPPKATRSGRNISLPSKFR